MKRYSAPKSEISADLRWLAEVRRKYPAALAVPILFCFALYRWRFRIFDLRTRGSLVIYRHGKYVAAILAQRLNLANEAIIELKSELGRQRALSS